MTQKIDHVYWIHVINRKTWWCVTCEHVQLQIKNGLWVCDNEYMRKMEESSHSLPTSRKRSSKQCKSASHCCIKSKVIWFLTDLNIHRKMMEDTQPMTNHMKSHWTSLYLQKPQLNWPHTHNVFTVQIRNQFFREKICRCSEQSNRE